MSDAEGRLDDARMYASLRDRRGDGMESNADERARERAEAVEDKAREILEANRPTCPECENAVATWATYSYHLATCELLRARAENEVDAAERAR